ncbi:hypothetical protein TGME49_286650 [Toxoplasma gondii ME49]|uniref:Uncharacterized protein n=1 Tax=Toxoplasma gondii (strain ATCC 50611 / Me49) TaxID=508771 RepID=S8F8D1_TOXGM|nr:hypothetical protein TGME49_286650 [Toxoplasma gondii ME49]EPT31002.1 hypothetical protein TGME49_286650 [Toxoplasma gondii ME49]|eukprot:XP_002369291.1 hypothetical protein TGME49_286650 [Toxoplasma gondii ME49]
MMQLCFDSRWGQRCTRWAAPVHYSHVVATCASSVAATNEMSVSEEAGINLNKIYLKVLVNTGVRTVGAVVLSAVPAMLCLRSPGARMFFVGATGGAVGGWNLHIADTILKDPLKHKNAIPKAATVAECAEELRREYYEALRRGFDFNRLSKGLEWMKDSLINVWKTTLSSSSTTTPGGNQDTKRE